MGRGGGFVSGRDLLDSVCMCVCVREKEKMGDLFPCNAGMGFMEEFGLRQTKLALIHA